MRNYTKVTFLSIVALWVGGGIAHSEAACKPVAEIYGKPICHEQIAIPAAQRDAIRKQGAQSGMDAAAAIAGYEKAALVSLVWEAALEKRFGAGSFSASEAEINAYLKGYRAQRETLKLYNRKTAELARGLRAKNKYDGQALAFIDTVISETGRAQELYNIQDMADSTPEAPVELRARAVTAIETWKGNQLLFKAYGGAAVRGEGGIVPVGAYRAFVEELRKAGHIRIVNSDFADSFAAMDAYLTQNHEAIGDKDMKQVKEYFDAPFWDVPDDMAQKRYEALKKELESLPVQGQKGNETGDEGKKP